MRRYQVVWWAMVGTLIVTGLAVTSAGQAPHPAEIVSPGEAGPSRGAFLVDFPGHPLPPGIGHDGQQFYAIARQPMHLEEVAEDLDRPRYRLQRITFPAMVWAVHPFGGGEGLVTATVLVGAAALLTASIATGRLSERLGGPPWLALIVSALPGAYATLRISTADTLALGAALLAVALSLGSRHRLATGAGVLAVLTKESAWLVLLGLAIWRRDRHGAALASIPAIAAATWWLWLRLTVPDTSEGVIEIVAPFTGWADALERWAAGEHTAGGALLTLAVALGALALVRVGWDHPLGPAIALQLGFLPFLAPDVIGPTFNAARTTMPLLALSIVALVAGSAETRPLTVQRSRAGADGTT